MNDKEQLLDQILELAETIQKRKKVPLETALIIALGIQRNDMLEDKLQALIEMVKELDKSIDSLNSIMFSKE
jgi:hypothetical protein